MIGRRQLLGIGVVIGMLHLTVVDAAWSTESAGSANTAAVKRQVDQLGVGAKVKIQLANGKRLKGTIKAVEEDRFLLLSTESSPMPVAYEQVAQLKLGSNTYKSKGRVDADEARRVAIRLGVGKHVVVKTVGGQEYHGHVLTIGSDSFKILPDRQTSSVEIRYTETLQLGPNPSTRAVVVSVVVVCTVAFILVQAFTTWRK